MKVITYYLYQKNSVITETKIIKDEVLLTMPFFYIIEILYLNADLFDRNHYIKYF